MSRARADSSAGDSNEPRGRARSRTFSHEQDSGFGADIDLLNAELDGKSPEEIEALKKEAAKQAAATNAALNSGINTRALKIVSSLDAAVARPEEENGLNDAPANKTLEEEEDELRLAEMEKRKREAEKAGDSGGASGRGRAKKDQGDYDVQIKLLLLGDSGVGKTSLMSRFSEDKFNMSQLSTAGVDYKSSYMDMGGKRVKCQVWDTAGQQRFHVITHSYYKGVHGIILVYDVADPTEERCVHYPNKSRRLSCTRYRQACGAAVVSAERQGALLSPLTCFAASITSDTGWRTSTSTPPLVHARS